MLHKIDYFSYTFMPLGHEGNQDDDWTPSLDYLRIHTPHYIDTSGESSIAPKRLGFLFGYAFDNHTYVWVSKTGLLLVEHTGAGCDHLEARGLLLGIVTSRADRATRIDIASDIHSPTRPIDFVGGRTYGKIESKGHYVSPTGETVYIGSQKSERFCRVYRYDGEHPRKDWLRLEYVYRREDAKIVCRQLLEATIAEVAIASGNRYGWSHDDWRLLR